MVCSDTINCVKRAGNESMLQLLRKVARMIISFVTPFVPTYEKGLLFNAGRGVADRFLSFTGRLADVNAAVDLLTYVPDQDFNSGQHTELLTVTMWQTGSTEAKVRVREGCSGYTHSTSIGRGIIVPSAL